MNRNKKLILLPKIEESSLKIIKINEIKVSSIKLNKITGKIGGSKYYDIPKSILS